MNECHIRARIDTDASSYQSTRGIQQQTVITMLTHIHTHTLSASDPLIKLIASSRSMAGANRCSALNYRFDLPLSSPIKLLIFIALIYLVFRVLLYGFSVQFFVFYVSPP